MTRHLATAPDSPSGKPSQSRFVTVAYILADLDVSRSTFDEWRTKGEAPRCIKLPNGRLRIERTEYEDWLNSRPEAA